VESCLQEPTCVLLATDADPAAIAAARANAARAGLASWIRFEVSDYAATPVPEGPRCIVINPPYGQRMGGDDAEIESLYRSIGAWLKRTGGPGSAVVISGHLRMARRIGLKAGRIHTVFNGPIECRLLEFPLYAPPSSPGG
jgi:putative N6-adenine-specific DNA methylase